MSTRTDTFLEMYPPESHSWAGKVAFGFSYPIHGWIQLAIMSTAYVQDAVVSLSNAFDPFPEFARWLTDIATGNLPSEFIIDEEGHGKVFRASPVNEEEFLFEILEWFYQKNKPETHPVYLYAQVHKKQFLAEFVRAWDDFLENRYDPVHWEEWGCDLRKLHLSEVRTFVPR